MKPWLVAFALLVACDSASAASDTGARNDTGSFQGVGDRCRALAVPAMGFVASEVYVETTNAQCGAGACMVFHLAGNPDCTSECVGCGGSTECGSCEGACVVEAGDAANSLARTFCTCRCGAGDPALPMCTCGAGMRCVADADPGGGYCVPDTL